MSAGREWLYENDFIVAEALETLDDALPSDFLRNLPPLSAPEDARGMTRVEVLARDLVRRGRGRVEVGELMLFLQGYQEIRPLRIAELWALPSFLRLALLEELADRAEADDPKTEFGPYILSLRTLAGEDWRGVVEELSIVHRVLQEDPSDVYSRMDFRTRDRYRVAVERVARLIKRPEELVARRVLEIAGDHPVGSRERHVGYHLIDEGLPPLIESLGGRPGFLASPARRRTLAAFGYFGAITLTSLAILASLALLFPAGILRTAFVVLAAIPALGTGVGVANRIIASIVGPRPLPRLDVRRGIPSRYRSVVAVPVLLTSVDEIESILHNLERNYQANPDPQLTFALLTDFPDAATERTEADDTLLAAAASGIRGLNRRYEEVGAEPFLLAHRARMWNESEGRWMGWERKRGKLAELNQLILGQPTGMWVVEGNATRLESVPFVLTLDADTRLPRDAAARLVGTIAHPLNRPEVGPNGRVLRGYSVLQPRIEILPDPDGGTGFSRVYGGVEGLDLYARAAFDVYQDLFDVGIFAGKGIYDVEAFEASLAHRTPENSLLSHDLFEGAHGRAGLVSDLILLEDFPTHPIGYARREHRWIRGDWQLLPWLAPRVPGERGESRKNRLTALSRWMVIDNLRRSLQGPALLGLFILGWAFVPRLTVVWTLALVAIIGLPFLTGSLDAFLRALRELPRRADLEAEMRAVRRALGRWGMDLTFLPFQVWNHCDAIVRTLWRVFVSRRKLLEWQTAAVTARTIRATDSLRLFVRRMWIGPVLAVTVALVLAALGGGISLASSPLLALWFISPAVAYGVSRSVRRKREERGEFPRRDARSLARRIWGYYERFQGPERHWLAPDHFQEEPGGEVAERTSPTNLGMAMVGAVTAWDLGFVGARRLVYRMDKTLSGMRRLARFRGHFLNWYDTRTARPMHPQYVSTVDSGNLAGSFIVTAGALREIGSRRLWSEEMAEGLVDTLRVVSETLRLSSQSGAAQALRVEIRALEIWMERNVFEGWRAGLPGFAHALRELTQRKLGELEASFERIRDEPREPTHSEPWVGVGQWLAHLRSDVESLLEELELFVPWLDPEFADANAAQGLQAGLDAAWQGGPTARGLADYLERTAAGLGAESSSEGLRDRLIGASEAVRRMIESGVALADELAVWFDEMDFSFLYDRRRRLFRIGFSVSVGELDPNHYDLLASEARIASTVAMAKDQAPPAHWLHLGRPFAWTDRGPVLLSWSGTMFEYLMPALFLRVPPESVLEEACRRAVDVQRDYGKSKGVPWGISESGYHVLSREGHYQYRAFGVPALGLSRAVGNRLVVAPYASLMAVTYAPGAVFRNLADIEELGGVGVWGPYEALDYGSTAARSGSPSVVKSYMSHHQGMILAALGNYLMGHKHVERYHSDPRIGTIDPYLHERIPWRRSIERSWIDRSAPSRFSGSGLGIESWVPPVRRIPRPCHHLSGQDFVVAIGPDGRGGSRWRDWSIVRGGVGSGVAAGGPDVLLRDRDTGESWQPLPDPRSQDGSDQEVRFEPHGAEFMRRMRDLRVRMRVQVPPGSSIELREITISNESTLKRKLRLALSAEMALAPYDDDIRHPAFQKLFVRAETLPGGEGLLFERRPRHRKEEPPVALVSVLGGEGDLPEIRWGTSREAFLGRNRTRDNPVGIEHPEVMVPPVGPHHPLDPVAAAVLDVDLAPWGESTIVLMIAAGPNRDTVVRNASEFRFPRRREWARIQARSRAEGELGLLGARGGDPVVWEELLSHVLYPHGIERVGRRTAATLDLRQSSLWRWGISGDIPFVLVEGDTDGADGGGLVSDLMRAQAWWRRRGVLVDLVVVGRGRGEYHDPLRERVRTHLAAHGAEAEVGRPGGVHLVMGDELSDEDRVRLRSLAAFRLDASRLSLREQVMVASATPEPRPASPARVTEAEPSDPVDSVPQARELDVPSALGGFDRHTGEYVIDLSAGETTPAPWVNVIAREGVGFLVTESGGSFTWVEDAGEFRLTPWNNDPVGGLRGEAVYLKDEESGEIWTPFAGPLGKNRPHTVRHGWGRTVLESESDGLAEEVTYCLHSARPVKIVRMTVRNRSNRSRRLSATFYVDWLLGVLPAMTAGRLQVEYDTQLSAVVARNPYLLKFSEKIAFLAADRFPDGRATDAEEFLGHTPPLEGPPAGLVGDVFGERDVPRGKACGALMRRITLAPGEEGSVTFFLGAVDRHEDLSSVLAELRASAHAGDIAADAFDEWQGYLGRVRVDTPDAGLDHLMNGWLPYQTISSRLAGRTGYYQSGGAFGFRDQLQDVYALLPLDPTLAEAHLVEAAKRQFPRGDVLHWWHPGTTRGVRTRCSDDLLWLPWVLAQTVRWTGDSSILDRQAPFIDGPDLGPEGRDLYHAFDATSEEASLWEHAVRAVERTASLLSPRGLPLMGSGDWNDGMDRVGEEGRGESVWLGWFFLDVCRLLLPLARERGDDGIALRMEDWSATIREGIERYAWDGEWYRRAFFDSGEPLGARESAEAQIDSLAQSWGVISGAADPVRARLAISSAWERLVRLDDGIVLLLNPPFTGNGPDPGYIAAYPPGVRENGGQYTHAAAWLIRALARAGEGDRVGSILSRMLPTRHAEGTEGTSRYRVEPYVFAADIYGMEPHVGRGGWTWYTGSAGWVWRVVLEDVLGVRREGSALRLDPCVPSDWAAFEIRIQVEDADVTIHVENPEGVCKGVRSCRVNGREVSPEEILVTGEVESGGGENGTSNRREISIHVTMGNPPD